MINVAYFIFKGHVCLVIALLVHGKRGADSARLSLLNANDLSKLTGHLMSSISCRCQLA